jgi:hypothetical protein
MQRKSGTGQFLASCSACGSEVLHTCPCVLLHHPPSPSSSFSPSTTPSPLPPFAGLSPLSSLLYPNLCVCNNVQHMFGICRACVKLSVVLKDRIINWPLPDQRVMKVTNHAYICIIMYTSDMLCRFVQTQAHSSQACILAGILAQG